MVLPVAPHEKKQTLKGDPPFPSPRGRKQKPDHPGFKTSQKLSWSRVTTNSPSAALKQHKMEVSYNKVCCKHLDIHYRKTHHPNGAAKQSPEMNAWQELRCRQGQRVVKAGWHRWFHSQQSSLTEQAAKDSSSPRGSGEVMKSLRAHKVPKGDTLFHTTQILQNHSLLFLCCTYPTGHFINSLLQHIPVQGTKAGSGGMRQSVRKSSLHMEPRALLWECNSITSQHSPHSPECTLWSQSSFRQTTACWNSWQWGIQTNTL